MIRVTASSLPRARLQTTLQISRQTYSGSAGCVTGAGPCRISEASKSLSLVADQQSKQLRQILHLALGERIELLLHRFAIGGPHFLLKRAALGRQCDELAAGELVVLMPRVVR